MFNQESKETVPTDLDLDKERERNTVQIRRQHREEVLAKKRVLQPFPSGIETEDQERGQPSSQAGEKPREAPRGASRQHEFIMYISKLNSADDQQMHEGMIGIRQLLASNSNVIQDVIDMNALPRIIQLALQEQYPKLRIEAAWALANVASGQHEQCQALVNRGGIPLFLQLLTSEDQVLVDQAVWAVSNLASDCVKNRDSLLVGGALHSIIKVINRTTNKAIRSSSIWALSNLCRGIYHDYSAIPSPKPDLIKDATPYIAQSVADPECDEQTLADCCWALYHLCQNPSNVVQVVSTPGLCSRLTEIVGWSHDQIVMPVIRIMGSILSSTIVHNLGQEKVAVVLARHDILTPFQKLLTHIKKMVRKEVCWCISNMAACSLDEVHPLLQRESLVKQLLHMLTQNETEIQLEIVWIFRNLATIHQQIVYSFMRTYKIIRFMVGLLSSTMEPRLQEAILGAIKMLLKLGEEFKEDKVNVLLMELKQLGAITRIESLQLSDSDDVYRLALEIIEEFCEVVDPLAP